MSFRVKAFCNWIPHDKAFEYFERYFAPNCGVKLVMNHLDADYFFVINYPFYADKGLFDSLNKKRIIIFHMEPSVAVKNWGEWANPSRSVFLQVRDHKAFPNNMEWHIDIPLEKLSRNISLKFFEAKLSTIVSSKFFDEGHIKRIQFLQYIQSINPYLVDIFGSCEIFKFQNYHGRLPDRDKSAGLMPYRYHFAAENNSEYNYITEKLIDPIVCETLCFYYGAPNADSYFGDAFIPLKLKDFKHDYAVILSAIQENEYEKRLPAIRRAKHLILTQYQIFPTLKNILITNSKRIKTYCLNLERRPDRREQMVARLDAAGIGDYEFRRAIDGRELVVDSEIIKLFKNLDLGYKRGAIGCALSHLRMWQELVADETAADDDYYMIMEDDVEFTLEFPKYFDFLVKCLYEKNPQWDIWFICCHILEYNLKSNWNKYRRIVRVEPPSIHSLDLNLFVGSTGCYIISKSGARKMCQIIDIHGIKHGIDYLPKKYCLEAGLNLYESQPHIATSPLILYSGTTGDTDIQNYEEFDAADFDERRQTISPS